MADGATCPQCGSEVTVPRLHRLSNWFVAIAMPVVAAMTLWSRFGSPESYRPVDTVQAGLDVLMWPALVVMAIALVAAAYALVRQRHYCATCRKWWRTQAGPGEDTAA